MNSVAFNPGSPTHTVLVCGGVEMRARKHFQFSKR
jgi:hypothetical protein